MGHCEISLDRFEEEKCPIIELFTYIAHINFIPPLLLEEYIIIITYFTIAKKIEEKKFDKIFSGKGNAIM